MSGLMGAPDLVRPWCVACGCNGRRMRIERHHAVPKGMGGTSDEGRIPLLSLCGLGNAGGCHGLAHSGMLHFRFDGGRWQCLPTAQPVKRVQALAMPGWLDCFGECPWQG